MGKLVIIDALAINDTIVKLGYVPRSDVMLRALMKGGAVLQGETRAQLRRKIGEGATRTSRNRPKPMEKGVTLKKDKDFNEVRVSIMGDFRLKWFELGTKERHLLRTGAKDRSRGRFSADKRYLYRKKGKENFYRAGTYRGRIKEFDYFREAREDSGAVINAINQSLYKDFQDLLK